MNREISTPKHASETTHETKMAIEAAAKASATAPAGCGREHGAEHRPSAEPHDDNLCAYELATLAQPDAAGRDDLLDLLDVFETRGLTDWLKAEDGNAHAP